MDQSSGTGIEIPTVLTIVFIVLKLTGNITWSWWWVLSPLWIAFGLFLVFLGIYLVVLARRYG